MPPHSNLLGHIPSMKRVLSKLPPDATMQYIPHQMRKTLPDLGSVFYLDNWPFSVPILVLSSPSSLKQAVQDHSLPKFPNMRNFVKPIAGELNLLTMEGPLWKRWRTLLNPCFNTNHMTEILPAMIEDVVNLKTTLTTRAHRGAMFQLKALTDDLVMDINGRMIL